MYKNKKQKEYTIHQAKGNRSPLPKNKNKTDSNGDEDTQSDDEYRLKTNKGNSKNLILGRVDNYALVNSERNVRLQQNTYRLSHFILKDNHESKCPDIISNRSPNRTSRNTERMQQQGNLTTSNTKYSIRNPLKKTACEHEDDNREETNIYIKKRVVTEGIINTHQDHQREINNEYRCSNPEHFTTYHDVYEEDNKSAGNEYLNSEINISRNPYDYYTEAAIIIQSNWKGFILRKQVFENLNFFYQIGMIGNLIKYNQKKFFWERLKKTSYAKKRLYIKSTLNMAKIPKIYNKNALLSQMGIFIYRKELTESFQFVRTKQQGGLINQEKYETKFEEVVDYKDKLKRKILKQILIMKLNKEQRNLKDAFNQFAICGLKAFIKKKSQNKIQVDRRQVLKSIYLNNKNKNSLMLKKYFMKMYFNGTLQFVENSMIHRVDSIKDENKTKLLRTIINGKDKEGKEALRRYLTDYKDKTIITTLNEKVREIAKSCLRKKIQRIVSEKEKTSNQFLKEQFRKFYYVGIFKQMKCLPQKIIIEPKITAVESNVATTIIDPQLIMKKKLKWIITTNYKNNESILKHYFMKYYYKAKCSQLSSPSIITQITPINNLPTPINQTPTINKTITIETDSKILDEVIELKTSYTTDHKKLSVRQILNAKKRTKLEVLRKQFWKFYFGGCFCLLKRKGDIMDRTSPNTHGKLGDLFSNDPAIKQTRNAGLKSAHIPNEPLSLENKNKIKRLLQTLTNMNNMKMRNRFNIFNLKVKCLKLQGLREAKIRFLLIKKETDIFKILLSFFTKYKLKVKVIRIKGILAKNKPEKKIKKKKKKKVNLDRVKTLPNFEKQQRDNNLMPQAREDDDDYYEDDDDFLLEKNDDLNEHEVTVSPNKPLRCKALKQKPIKDNNNNDNEDNHKDDEKEEFAFSNSKVKQIIMMHVKLLNIFQCKHFNTLSGYFNRLRNPNKNTNIQLETYKTALFVKIVSTWSNRNNLKLLKHKFFQWKNSGYNLKRNITATLCIFKLSNLIKKITYKWYFDRFFLNFLEELQYKQLRKVINNSEMRQVRLRNKDFRNKFYTFAGKRPTFKFASYVIYMMNAFQKVEDSFKHIQLIRKMRKFFIRFIRKAMWEKPLVPRFTVSNITYYLKNGQIVHLTRNDSRLRNFLWRYRNPRKYYFRKYYARVLKIKEKELEAQSRKWEFEDYNPIDKKPHRKKIE